MFTFSLCSAHHAATVSPLALHSQISSVSTIYRKAEMPHHFILQTIIGLPRKFRKSSVGCRLSAERYYSFELYIVSQLESCSSKLLYFSLKTIISIRLFLSLPLDVELSSTGLYSPYPTATSLLGKKSHLLINS